MDNYEVVLLAPAWRELDEISNMHMTLVGAKSAMKITDKILDCIDKLKTSPFMGVAVREPILEDSNYRKFICGNYLCFYKVMNQIVYIYHIADGRTNYPKIFEENK